MILFRLPPGFSLRRTGESFPIESSHRPDAGLRVLTPDASHGWGSFLHPLLAHLERPIDRLP